MDGCFGVPPPLSGCIGAATDQAAFRVMNSSESDPLCQTVQWLARHTGFPTVRLPAKAEVMVCVAALAASEEEEAARQRFLLERRVGSQTSAQRQHAQRRAQVHFKCDNSAKV